MSTTKDDCQLTDLKGLKPLPSDFVRGQILGTGSKSTVYQATYHHHDVAVAVDDQSPAETRDAWLQASKVLTRLRHPYVVRTFKYYMDDVGGQIRCRIMKRGHQTLQKWLQTQREKDTVLAPWSMRLGILLQIAQGYHYLESEVKDVNEVCMPSSKILLQKSLEDDTWTTLIIPNIATDYKNDRSRTFAQRTSQFWLAPEQHNNKTKTTYAQGKRYSYSMMLLLHCMLTNLPPYHEIKIQVAISQIQSGVLPKIPTDGSIVKEETPKGYLQLRSACGAFKPDARPSMEDIILELQRMLQLVTKGVTEPLPLGM